MSPIAPPRRSIARSRHALLGVAIMSLSATPSLGAQSFSTARESSNAAAVHSAPAAGRRWLVAGERALYELRLGGRAVGTGSLEVVGEERVNGHSTMHTVLQVTGGVLFARVNERFESWIDPEQLFSRKFVQDQQELTKHRHREYTMSPETKTFSSAEDGEQAPMSSQRPLDDIAFLFHARTLPLNVGDVDTIPRYFKPGHDVILRVLRHQRITVPAGTFETVVVQPTITNVGGLFGQGGEAEVYFTDDAERTIVQIRSKVPVVGSLSLHLKEFRSAR